MQLVSKKMHTVATEVETGLPQYATEATHLMLQQPNSTAQRHTSGSVIVTEVRLPWPHGDCTALLAFVTATDLVLTRSYEIPLLVLFSTVSLQVKMEIGNAA